jgi:uncharacterized protein
MTHPAAHPRTSQVIHTEAQRRALLGAPTELTRAKISPGLNALTRKFIERSPWVGIATITTGGQIHRAIQGEQFDAEHDDKQRTERYRGRLGFY